MTDPTQDPKNQPDPNEPGEKSGAPNHDRSKEPAEPGSGRDEGRDDQKRAGARG